MATKARAPADRIRASLVDGVKVPSDAQTPEPYGGQAATGDLTTNRVNRNKGDAEAGHHRLMASVWLSSMPTRQRTPARSSVRSVTCRVAEPSSRTSSGSSARHAGATSRDRAQG